MTTTRAVTSSVEFTSQIDPRWDDPANDVWYGASTLDGVKGSELVVRKFVRDQFGDPSPMVALGVYTWRSGALVAQKAPSATFVKGWNLGGFDEHVQGYRFFSSHGRRYVDVSNLKWKSGKHPVWYGKVTRSVWRHGHWTKVSTRSFKKSDAKSASYLGFSGSAMLRGWVTPTSTATPGPMRSGSTGIR